MYAKQTIFCPNQLLDRSPIDYNHLRDDELIVACQKQDRLAFAILYKRYKHVVFSKLHRLSPDLSNSHEDMVQEVFLRLWCSIGTLKNPLAFKTWLNRLISNLFYDVLRKRPKSMILSLDQPINGEDGDTFLSHDIQDTRSRPDEEFEKNELMRQITDAIRLLPDQFAEVITLREINGLEYSEIAHITHCQLGTVKSRIARGKTKLQSRLKRLTA